MPDYYKIGNAVKSRIQIRFGSFMAEFCVDMCILILCPHPSVVETREWEY